jgi:hypothetical protein
MTSPFESENSGMSESLAFNVDGVIRNVATKLGGREDIDTYSKPQDLGKCWLSQCELEDFYASDSFAQKVVGLIPAEMMLGGVEIQFEGGTAFHEDEKQQAKESLAEQVKFRNSANKFHRYLRKSKIVRAMYEANLLTNLYNRGAGVVLDIRDGRRWNDPVDVDNIDSFRVAFVADGYRLIPTYLGFSVEPEYFTVTLSATDPLGDDFSDNESGNLIQQARQKGAIAVSRYLAENNLDRIHPDRVLWQEGVYTPWSLRTRTSDGGSVGRLQRFWPHYSRYVGGLGAASNILHRMEVLNVKRSGLVRLLTKHGADAEQMIREQMESLQLMMTNLGIALTDKEQTDLEIVRRSLGGVPQVLNEFKRAMIANSGGIPEIFLFDHVSVSGGLGGNDSQPRTLLADAVHSRQITEHLDHYEKFFEYLLRSRRGPTGGEDPDNWVVYFPSTLKLSLTEQVALQERHARVDKMYREMGVSSRSIIQSRWGSGQWTPGLNLLDPVKEFIAGRPEPIDPRTEGYLVPSLPDKTSGDMNEIVTNFEEVVATWETTMAEQNLEGDLEGLEEGGGGDMGGDLGMGGEGMGEEELSPEELAALEEEIEAELTAAEGEGEEEEDEETVAASEGEDDE